jgi:hypothetical protein
VRQCEFDTREAVLVRQCKLRKMLLLQKCKTYRGETQQERDMQKRDTAGERHGRKETRQRRDTAGERRSRGETADKS